jgi:hypothetical protein
LPLSIEDLKRRFPRRSYEIDLLFNKFFEEERRIKKDEIISEMKRYEKHLELARAISSCFYSDGNISNESGYEFRFTEPLLDFGVKNFDILISNRIKMAILIVECKTIDGGITNSKVKRILKETQERKEVVLNHITDLESQVDHGIDPDMVEIGLLVDGVDVDDLISEYEKVDISLKANIVILSYDEMEERISLAKGFRMKLNEIKELLVGGIDIFECRKPLFNIPCLIQDLHFSVFLNIYIDRTGAKGSYLKDLSSSDLRKGLKQIPLGASKSRMDEMINKKVDDIIRHLEKYDLINKKEEGRDRYHILCKGEKRHVIRERLIEKYIENRSRELARRSSVIKVKDSIDRSAELDKWL